MKTGKVDKVLKRLIGEDLALIVDGEEKNKEFELATRNLRSVMYYSQLVDLERGGNL